MYRSLDWGIISPLMLGFTVTVIYLKCLEVALTSLSIVSVMDSHHVRTDMHDWAEREREREGENHL